MVIVWLELKDPSITLKGVSLVSFGDKRAGYGKIRQYRVKKQYSFSNFSQIGPLASYLNKREDYSFIFKEVYPDAAHNIEPLCVSRHRLSESTLQ